MYTFHVVMLIATLNAVPVTTQNVGHFKSEAECNDQLPLLVALSQHQLDTTKNPKMAKLRGKVLIARAECERSLGL